MKHFKGIFFDLNGTLIDIRTDEGQEGLYRGMSHLLSFYGIPMDENGFRDRYYQIMKEQRRINPAEHPEFDVVGIFRQIMAEHPGPGLKTLPLRVAEELPRFFARAFRSFSMIQLQLFPGVTEVLERLQKEYRLAAVSDGQAVWAEPELRRFGLERFFPVRIISSDLCCRKPNPVIFQKALDALALKPEEVIYVGNDMFRDVKGAKDMGMKSVFFRSNQGDWTPHGAEPDYIIYSMEQLPQAVEFLEKQSAEKGR